MQPTNNESPNFLAPYIPLVKFLGQALGPSTEIVLHDLDTPEHSIITIANNHISGREIGGPVTDFALWFMKQGNINQVPMLTGYKAVNSEGHITRSSSYFIRNENNIIRGMLCINVDVSDWQKIKDISSTMVAFLENTIPNKLDIREDNFSPNDESIVSLDKELSKNLILEEEIINSTKNKFDGFDTEKIIFLGSIAFPTKKKLKKVLVVIFKICLTLY